MSFPITCNRVIPKSIAFVSRVVTHPSWARAHVQNVLDKKYDEVLPSWPAPATTLTVSEAVACLGAANADASIETMGRWPDFERGGATALYGAPDASTALVELLYAYCRAARPQAVVEVGVAHGYTSAAILRALAGNGSGHLYSIDLPHLHPRAERHIGRAVDPQLRSRWSLVLGPSSELIPKVVREVGRPVDLAVHDGTHTLRGQLADYQQLWASIRPGGVLISDDAGPAASLLSDLTQTEGMYVRQPPKRLPIAVFVKAAGLAEMRQEQQRQ